MTIYLDNAATSYPKPPLVYTRMAEVLQTAGANPGRASHRLARAAQQIVEDTRLKLARFIGATNPKQIVFTLNATDALNIVLKGILIPGDHVITTRLEHNSVLRPLRRLIVDKQITLTLLDFDPAGFISLMELERAINSQTKLIALTAASNVLGTLQPLAAVAEIAHRYGVLFLVDAAQSLGSVPVDVVAMDIDLLAGSGHKGLLGPPGTGFLYIGTNSEIACWREGGTGGDSLAELQPTELPLRFEAGTLNTVGIAGLGAGLDYIGEVGIANIREHELLLTNQLMLGLRALPQVSMYGCVRLEQRVGTVAFALAGYRADEVAAILDESFDIAVRAGLHCAPLVHESLGTVVYGLVRVSVGPFNTSTEIDIFLEAITALVA